MKLLTVENDTEKPKSEDASTTKANRNQISTISSKSLGSNDRLFRNAISALRKGKGTVGKESCKGHKKHLETKAELKDARNAKKKLQKRLHMHENQKMTFSGTLPPDVVLLLAWQERKKHCSVEAMAIIHHRQAKHWVPHKVGKLRNC